MKNSQILVISCLETKNARRSISRCRALTLLVVKGSNSDESSPGRARTSDTRINSPLLCRLSYRGICLWETELYSLRSPFSSLTLPNFITLPPTKPQKFPLPTVVTDVAGNHDSKSSESTGGNFGAPLFSRFFSYSYSASRYSYSYSYSKRPSIAIRPIGPQITANCLDQRLASSQLHQPSSTSTVSLSTSTSTTKSDAMHEPRNNPPSTTIESLKPAGWISMAYPGAMYLRRNQKILSRNARSSRLIFKEPLFEAS